LIIDGYLERVWKALSEDLGKLKCPCKLRHSSVAEYSNFDVSPTGSILGLFICKKLGTGAGHHNGEENEEGDQKVSAEGVGKGDSKEESPQNYKGPEREGDQGKEA
jgi:hypothetical protein